MVRANSYKMLYDQPPRRLVVDDCRTEVVTKTKVLVKNSNSLVNRIPDAGPLVRRNGVGHSGGPISERGRFNRLKQFFF